MDFPGSLHAAGASKCNSDLSLDLEMSSKVLKTSRHQNYMCKVTNQLTAKTKASSHLVAQRASYPFKGSWHVTSVYCSLKLIRMLTIPNIRREGLEKWKLCAFFMRMESDTKPTKRRLFVVWRGW